MKQKAFLRQFQCKLIFRECPMGPLGVWSTSERVQGPFQLITNFCKTVSHKILKNKFTKYLSTSLRNLLLHISPRLSVFQLTPSFSNIMVYRRYKHFDWLRSRLVAKFGAIIVIPPLPSKTVLGISIGERYRY